jgi:hypothetical protein
MHMLQKTIPSSIPPSPNPKADTRLDLDFLHVMSRLLIVLSANVSSDPTLRRILRNSQWIVGKGDDKEAAGWKDKYEKSKSTLTASAAMQIG